MYQIYVFFPIEAKVGVTTMRDCTKRMQSQNVFRAILVSQTKLTPFATRCISEMSSKFHMEVFQVILKSHECHRGNVRSLEISLFLLRGGLT